MRKCANMVRHSTAPLFSNVNESEPKWAVLEVKNLHLGLSSLPSFVGFYQESCDSCLERCETFKLVEIWGKEGIHALLEGCTCNKQVYNKSVRNGRSGIQKEWSAMQRQDEEVEE